ncbi:MAG: hypothetical protein D3910_06300 [Candidatus Electrothrix sp. ATG2]|nr:hypothetical protein [Candidatus Electrothrix sp. ATG2]
MSVFIGGEVYLYEKVFFKKPLYSLCPLSSIKNAAPRKGYGKQERIRNFSVTGRDQNVIAYCWGKEHLQPQGSPAGLPYPLHPAQW